MPVLTKSWLFKALLGVLTILLLFFTRRTWIIAARVFFLAAVFTIILSPLCHRLESLGISKGISAFLCLAVFVVILGVFLLIFIPYLVSGLVDFIRRMTPTILNTMETIIDALERIGHRQTVTTDAAQLLASMLTPLTTNVAKGSAALIRTTGHVAFSLVITYYSLTIRETLAAYLLLIVPSALRRFFLSAVSGCKNAILSYLSGTLKTSAFVGLATLVTLLILDVKDALILSLFMSVLEVLPYIGPVLGSIPILLSTLSMGMGKTLLALGLLVLIQQLEASVVAPYFTASSTSIHPLAAIICVFIGGSLFGIPGILLSIPILIIVKSTFWSIHSASIHFDT